MLQAQLELERADQPAPAVTPPLSPPLLPLVNCKQGNGFLEQFQIWEVP